MSETRSATLAETVRELERRRADLAAHEQSAAGKSEALKREIAAHLTALQRAEAGLDLERIELAETVVFATNHANGGSEWNGARQDAIRFIATGKPLQPPYGDLRREYFGTKNYDRWRGQREDHNYGMGPRHGSVCFRIGLTEKARCRELTEAERDAAIYYLLNLERIQNSRASA